MLSTRPPLDPFPYQRHPTSRPFGPDLDAGQYVFAQSADGTAWAVPETEGHLHPRILGGGEPAAAAGGLLIDAGGVIVEIDNFSGTFRFGPEVFPQVLAALARQGADVSAVREVVFEYD